MLILVKHSLPDIVPGAAARTWLLSEEGRRRCGPLADALAAHRDSVLVSSVEPKARDTAREVARRWGVPVHVRDGLEEQHRDTAPFLSPEAFRDAIRDFFARPSELVFGEETADAAYERFAAAIDGLLDEHPGESITVVTHGTVLALYLSRRAGTDAWTVWQQLGLPSAVVLDRESHGITTTVFHVT